MPFTIFLLFFFQSLIDFIASIYCLNLLTLSMNASCGWILIILFPGILFLTWRDSLNIKFVYWKGQCAILCRAIGPFLPLSWRVLIDGLAVAGFLTVYPFLLKKAKTRNPHFFPMSSGLCMILSIQILALSNTLGAGTDILALGSGKWAGIGLSIAASICLHKYWTQNCIRYEEENYEKQNMEEPASSLWRTLGVSLSLFAILTMVYLAFTSPYLLCRWGETDTLFTTICYSLSLCAFFCIFAFCPDCWKIPDCWNGKKFIFILWHAFFAIFLLMASGLYDPAFSFWQTLGIYGATILFPILAIHFSMVSQAIHKAGIRSLGAGFLLGAIYLIFIVISSIFTLVYDYIPWIGHWFRDRFWVVAAVGCLMTMLPFCLKLGIKSESPGIRPESPERKSGRRLGFFLYVCISITIATGNIVWASINRPCPVVATNNASIKVVTYNIQQGFDGDGNNNFHCVLDALQTIQPDILGLQESDTCRISSGNADVVQFLSSRLNMHSYFGPKTTTGTFGIALLSRFPILYSRTHYMPSHGEQTALIEAQIQVGEKRVHTFVAHFGESEIDHTLQTRRLLEIIRGKENVLLLGDFNIPPHSRQYNFIRTVLQDAWQVKWNPEIQGSFAHDGEIPKARIDYIFVSPDIAVLDCTVHKKIYASDHRPVSAVIGAK